MKKLVKWFAALIIVSVVFYIVVPVNVVSLFQSPEEVLQSFYAHDGAEDMLMDPLVLSGEEVVPLVIKEVENTEMPRRRYAIAFLGNGNYLNALPVLREILRNEGEKDYFRGDALISIYRINHCCPVNFHSKTI